ncbi:MAG: hypothetical protein AB3N63_06950 [Puniceicoccaceae bacterium]
MTFTFSVSAEKKVDPCRSAWMEGGWGVRILLPGGDREELGSFEVEEFAEQIKQLDSISWVMLNVTQGACGSLYTAPHPVLEKHIHPAMAPTRDLLGEMIKELRKSDVKVLVYYASEGPAKVKKWTHHLEYTVQGSFENWDKYCATLEMTSKQAIAEKIIKYYSLKYGKNIDGWWFDHAGHADTKLFADAARAGNPNSVVSFNMGHTGQVARGAAEEDVAFGHPTQIVKQLPSWEGNASMIRTIENSQYVDGVLGHMFIPMQKGWWKHEPVFSTEQATDWTLRVVKAKGAYTWAVALGENADDMFGMADYQFAQLLEINKQIKRLRQ